MSHNIHACSEHLYMCVSVCSCWRVTCSGVKMQQIFWDRVAAAPSSTEPNTEAIRWPLNASTSTRNANSSHSTAAQVRHTPLLPLHFLPNQPLLSLDCPARHTESARWVIRVRDDWLVFLQAHVRSEDKALSFYSSLAAALTDGISC